MYVHFVKYIFVYINAFSFYSTLSDLRTRRDKVKFSVIILLLSLFNTISRMNHPLLSTALSFFAFFLSTLFCSTVKMKVGFLISLISFCLSHALLTIFFFIYYVIISLFNTNFSGDPDIFTILFSGIISVTISHYICHWRRFKKGMKYLYKEPIATVMSIIGIAIITCLTIPQVIILPDYRAKLISLLILASACLLLFLWQRQIKRYYLSKLRKLELESLRQELEEKDETIQKLMESNDNLARTIHKDNKLIPAMLSAVNDYLSYTGDENSEQTSHGKLLAEQLRKLGCDRMELLAKSTRLNESLPQTGDAVVDAMLDYMGKRAEAEKIKFQVKLHPDFCSKIGTEVSEADLTHLLSDLIENALIASKTVNHKSVLVHLGVLDNAPTLEISDSGIPFAPEVYQDFGLSRHSTHLDNGGSGIGLMDIWKLKKKYAASLHIYEYPPTPEGFTKKICLVFDHKKHYLIRSFRSKELLKVQTRGDLYILPLEEDTD